MTLKRRLLPALTGVALLASACAGASEQTADEAPATSEAAVVTDSPEAAGPIVASEALSFAIQSIEDSSYSFEQGLTLELDLFGEPVTIGPDGAFVTGQFDEGESMINADVGSFLVSVLEPFGFSDDSAVFGQLLGGLDTAELDVWTTEDVVVIDLSELVSAIGVLDPTASTELDVFAEGPVSIDLNRLAELGVDPAVGGSDIASQFGGAQIPDPADIVGALRSIDVLEAAGTESLGGEDVDVYTAEISFADFVEATGEGIDSQLGPLGTFGLDAPDLDGEELLEDLENIDVDLTIWVDADDLVRHVITNIDLSTILGDLAGAGAPGVGADGNFIVETWQTFDDYGTDFDIVIPDAIDVTSEIAGQLDS